LDFWTFSVDFPFSALDPSKGVEFVAEVMEDDVVLVVEAEEA
jgi:hypothetical protein